MKRITVALLLLFGFAAITLSGCMPASGGLEGDAPTSSDSLMNFIPIILIVVVFYFILIRPQNKKNKEVTQMRNALKRGDWVTTIGGFRGRVIKIKDDLLTIEVGVDKVRLEIMRWGVSKIDTEGPVRRSSKKDREEEEELEAEEKKRAPKKLEPAKKKAAESKDDDEDDDD